MSAMNSDGAATVAPTPTPDARQAAAWVARSLVLFVVLLVGTLMVASRLTSDLGPAGLGGMFPLDSPLTLAALAIAVAYTIAAVAPWTANSGDRRGGELQ